VNAAHRAAALARMRTETFDVVVVGGGVTGAGAALDAATRGKSVALVEARDLAAGTSSRSGKVFHGGLRYLEQLNFALVRSALRERDLMVERLCPHLARPVPFLFPVATPWERSYMGAGILLYDLLRGVGGSPVPRHRHLTRRATLAEMPALRPERVRGGIQYGDVRVDDARHTLLLARTAAHFGAAVATRTEMTGALTDDGRVTGVRARDRETGAELAIRGRAVISATGVWADAVQRMAGDVQVEVQPAKGIHLVVPRARIPSRTGLTARAGDSVLVIRPWWGSWIIGTTDTAWAHGPDDPAASGADVDYLLQAANGWLRDPLTRDDVTGVFAGLRPLLRGTGASTAALSRDHVVLETTPGLFTVVGGKYTTYRLMAEDAVDAALGPGAPPSVTARTPLLGAADAPAARNGAGASCAAVGLDPAWSEPLWERHGALMTEVLDLVAGRPELGRPLAGAPAYLEAEVVHAATHEGALHLDDVLARRTHAAWEVADRGLEASARAAALLAEALGWDDARRTGELESYRERVAADRRAEGAADDAAAVAARAGRPRAA